jgi:membrane-associated phospholipid phosphatase
MSVTEGRSLLLTRAIPHKLCGSGYHSGRDLMKWIRLPGAGALAGVTVLALSAPASAQHTSLYSDFSPVELGVIGGLAAADLTLFALEPTIAPRMTAHIGDPLDIDVNISRALYRGDGAGRWLGGIPDITGSIILPIATFTFYGVNAVTREAAGRSATNEDNPDHKFFALSEAYAITLGLTETAKLFIGRERPSVFLRRPDVTVGDVQNKLSFFSGHTSSSFCLAAFGARDLGDWLTTAPLGGESTLTKALLGRALPSLVLYSAASVVGLSRIIDQRHYFTDTLVAAAVGALVGNLVYAAHFDGSGRPRNTGEAPVPLSAPMVFSFRGVF